MSTNMDIESLRYPSWCLSRLLDKIIGTKEVVSLRRKKDAMIDYIYDVYTSFKIFNSGSRGEGFDFSSSDIDTMFINKTAVVLESLYGTRSTDGKTSLLMEREGCNPGFVILWLLNRTNDRAITESVVEYHGHSVVSSLLYRDVHRRSEYGEVGHGPCNTHQDISGMDMDIASCFECDKWPKEANEFIYRQRLYGWPEKSLLDRIICKGCHLVPIGDKNHDLSYIQWRLSFSAAEKDLVHSFNHTQFLVYGLLKIFLKQFITKFQLPDGILCSYFLKTAVFYSIESTPSYLWRDDLLILCFWFCINKLSTWVEQGYCPNYFVKQNNMFRNKVFGQHRHNLLSVLYQCKRIGWSCIYLCEDLQVLQIIVSHPELLYSSGLITSEKEREFSLDQIATTGVFADGSYTEPKDSHKHLARSLTLFTYSRSEKEREYSTSLLLRDFTNITLSVVCFDGSDNNKNKYKTIRKCQRLLVTSTEGYGYSGLFSLATFYYKTGQYQKAIHNLKRVLLLWKPYVLYLSVLHMELYHIDLYQHYICGRCNTSNDKVSTFARDIVIVKDQSFYPVELCHDIEATNPFHLCIPPLPYTMFLLFLCHHKLGDSDRSLAVFHDLKVLSRDEIQGCRRYPVFFNLLAICLDKLGCRHGAVEMCLKSQDVKQDKNGAGSLLHKILSDLC